MELKDKKVLLIGLGILGGGLSIAQYLLKRGAKLTISDLRTKKDLEQMIKKIEKSYPKKVKYIFEKNPEDEIKNTDLIILNPAVSAYSPIIKKIKSLKKEYYSDYTFFLKNIAKNKKSKIIGITGTRGKTTITTWTHQFIEKSTIGGNIPEAGLFKIIDKKPEWFVLELSSFQLEHLRGRELSPNIAILTNIYVDHLNRYKTFKRYSGVKKKIYTKQKHSDILIISNDEATTKEIEKAKKESKILYISLKKLPQKKDGLFILDNDVFEKKGKKINKIGSLKNFAPHEKNNFMFAALAANLTGVSWDKIFKKVKELKNPIFRQQEVYNQNGLKIINDSAGTSPDATIAAIEKFKNKNLFLITGGTNKELQYGGLAKKIEKDVAASKLYLLSGSGTNELIKKLSINYYKKNEIKIFDSLEEIIKTVKSKTNKGIILFSPAGASFEKFKNEFDRGQQFNKLIKKYFN